MNLNSANAKSVTVKAKWCQTTYNFSYKNSAQTFTADCTGYYKVELWGASGGVGHYHIATSWPYRNRLNYGAYVSGEIQINKNSQLYIYTGGKGVDQTTETINDHAAGGYNGGGQGGYSTGDDAGGGGGGSTDVRIISGAWDNSASLRSRIMVASGGGGTVSANYEITEDIGGYVAGNGLIVASSMSQSASKSCGNTLPEVSNTSGNAFGYGYIGTDEGTIHGSGGGGGGWYGGNSIYNSSCKYWSSAQGGSSYISGHTGSVAVTSTSSSSPKTGCTTGTTNTTCSITPYKNPVTNAGYTFANTVMIDGLGYGWTYIKGARKYMPNPSGGNYSSGTGHTGNGYARITYLGTSI